MSSAESEEMMARTRREGGAYRNEQSLFEWSKLCSAPTDIFYQFCYWQLPTLSHFEHMQSWPMVQGWHEYKFREYNV
jgi:hypothetical protein